MKNKKLITFMLTTAILLSSSIFLNKNLVKADTLNIVGVTYRGHVQSIGWQPYVSDGIEAGTDGKSLRVEALNIKLVNAPAGASIKYQGHIQSIGWQNVIADGIEAGTDGKSLRIEAIKLALINLPGYSVQYRTHIQNIGWQSWVSNGVISGTEGKGLRIEAIEIKIVKTIDGSTPKPLDFLPVTPIIAPNTLIYTWETVKSKMLNAKIGPNFRELQGITEGKSWSSLQYNSHPEYTQAGSTYDVLDMNSLKGSEPNMDIGIIILGNVDQSPKILANLQLTNDVLCEALFPGHGKEFDVLTSNAKLRHVEKGNNQIDFPNVYFFGGRRIIVTLHSMGWTSYYLSAINDKTNIWTELESIDDGMSYMKFTRAQLKTYMPELKNY